MTFLRYSFAHLKALQKSPTDRNVETQLSLRLQQDTALRRFSNFVICTVLTATLDEIVQPFGRPAEPLLTELQGNKSSIKSRSGILMTTRQQLDGADAEWQYSGRTGVECAGNQPIPAPPELQTQQNEGFQRFFKAVVSPSHVRVTAGGRIVPNTRSSPASKHLKDRPFPEAPSMQKGCHPGFSSGQHLIAGPAYHAYPPFFPAFATTMHGFPPPGPYPWPPWQVGLNVCAPYPHYALGQNLGHDASHQGSDKYTGTINTGKVDPFRHGLGPMDQSQPGQHREHWNTPPPAPIYPHVAQTLPKSVEQDLPAASEAKSQGPATAVSAKSPKLNSSSGDSKTDGAATAQSSSNPGIFSHTPISSIRPSHITKKQIDVLKSSLRYLEDQLQYNKHQIDEKAVGNQADLVREQIRHFKSNLSVQRSFEDSHYPKPNSKSEDSDSSNVLNGVSRIANTESSLSSDSGQEASTRPHEEQRVTASKVSLRSASKLVTDCVTASELLASPTKSSRLPGHAAMAPPFRPRVGGELEKASWDASVNRFAAPDVVASSNNPISQSSSLRSRHACSHELTGDELRARHAYWGAFSGSLLTVFPTGDSFCYNHAHSANGDIQKPHCKEGSASTSITEARSTRPYDCMRLGSQIRHREDLGLTTQSESYLRHETESSASTLASPRTESCILPAGVTRKYDLASYQTSIRDGSDGGTPSTSFSASLNDTQLKTPHAMYGLMLPKH